MPFNPDTIDRNRRMGAHVYHVEGGVDLTPWGFPGVTFEGDVDVDIEGEDQDQWYISDVKALDAKGYVHSYDMHQGIGEAVAAALYADAFHSSLIEDCCWYHGEG